MYCKLGGVLMPIQKQYAEFPIVGGHSDHNDPNRTPTGKNTEVLNGRFDKFGRITKRRGFAGIGTASLTPFNQVNSELQGIDGITR